MTDSLEEFRRYLRWNRGLASRTVAQYSEAVREYFVRPRRFTKESVEAYLVDKQVALGSQSPSAWNWRLAGLRAYGEFLKKQGLVERNAIHDIAWKTLNSKPKEPLTRDEVFTLLDGFEGQTKFVCLRNQLAVTIMAVCGLRVAEVVSLQVSQVDLAKRKFHDVIRKRGKVLSMPFNGVVARGLVSYMAERDRRPLEADEDAFLISIRNRRVSIRTIQHAIRQCGVRTGLGSERRPVTPHLIRHTCITVMRENGVSLATAQGFAGHESMQTTQRYDHSLELQLQRAMDDMEVVWDRDAENA